jgi:hypothetical protein
LRHWDNLIETQSVPHENMRLEVSRAFLDETIRCLRENIQGWKKN